MYYSITFGDGSLYPESHEKAGQMMGKNTWEDWHLIPSSRPVIASPGFSSKFVDIPGRSGAIDLSDYLCGRPVFGDRSGSLEFYVDNDHEHWETIRMKVMNYVHGRRYKICLEDDPRFYWEGRFTMSDWRSEANNSKITLTYALSPFKTALRDVEADPDVIWDTFNFERDLFWRSKIEALLEGVTLDNETVELEVPESEYFMSVSMALEEGTGVFVTFEGRTANLATEKPSAVLYSDKLSGGTISLNGTGTVRFGFRERSL